MWCSRSCASAATRARIGDPERLAAPTTLRATRRRIGALKLHWATSEVDWGRLGHWRWTGSRTVCWGFAITFGDGRRMWGAVARSAARNTAAHARSSPREWGAIPEEIQYDRVNFAAELHVPECACGIRQLRLGIRCAQVLLQEPERQAGPCSSSPGLQIQSVTVFG
jgi:hypothetical protein